MILQTNAEDFLNAFEVLNESNEALINRLSISPGNPSALKAFGVFPTGGADIVCLSFSVELYIKDVHFAVKGKVPRGHNILKLFEKLPEQIQQEIFAHDSICQNPFFTRGDIFMTKRITSAYSAYDGFIDQIKAISDGFVKWRYSYESTTLRYDTSFALALIESLKKAVADARKDN